MRAVVTGVSGLIGSRFIEVFSSSFDKVYQVGRTPVDINAEWIEYDFASGLPLELPEVDVIFHFSGQTSIYESKNNVLSSMNVNALGFLHLLESAKKQKQQPFVVFAGTATQVGFTNDGKPINEHRCDRPSTFYDISKLTAENYLLQFVTEGWLKGCSLRLCNVYGGKKDGQNLDRGVIDKVFQLAVNGESISLYGSGEYIRDYIHIDDVVSAFYYAWVNRNLTNGQYFNIGTGVGVSLKDAFYLMARLAKEINGKKAKVISVKPPVWLSSIEFRSFVADSTKFREATEWLPKYNLETGIRHSYKFFFDKGF